MWFLVGLFFFIFGNWFLGLTSLDEGRNASVVLNMLSSKDFLVPYYNCHVRFEKPPMLYYFGLVFAKPFGLNEFSLRLVSGLSAFGVGIFTYPYGEAFL
jgi:4-amino-4-deoxy-L-arabinose transferase-like glycosyltransferase